MKKALLFFFLISLVSPSYGRLLIEKREVSLGKVIKGRPIVYTFVIKNLGKRKVSIRKVVPG